MLQVKEIIALVEAHIPNAGFPDEPKGLFDPARYILSAGGKRIRPCLSLMCANLYDNNLEPHIPVALAMEVFHNFTLVHDDIMDKAPVRRGMPTVHEKWNLVTGILSGDAMLIQAYKLISRANPQYLPAILTMFNNTAMQVCEGQQFDMDFEQRTDVTLPEYITMITNKTSVLLGGSMYCGAIAAGAPESDAQLLYEAGLALGVSFQIQDDVLDAYGDAQQFGKKPGGDIIQHKKTYLILKALELTKGAEREHLLALYQSDTDNESEKIAAVLAIFEQYQIKSAAEEVMLSYYNTAMAAIENVKLPQEKKIPLLGLVTNVFGRNY